MQRLLLVKFGNNVDDHLELRCYGIHNPREAMHLRSDLGKGLGMVIWKTRIFSCRSLTTGIESRVGVQDTRYNRCLVSIS